MNLYRSTYKSEPAFCGEAGARRLPSWPTSRRRPARRHRIVERHPKPLEKALTQHAKGKVVSKRASTSGERAYKHIQAWTMIVKAAREKLLATGTGAVGRKNHEGKAIYVKAKATLALATISTLSLLAPGGICHCAPGSASIATAEEERKFEKKKTALPKALRKA